MKNIILAFVLTALGWTATAQNTFSNAVDSDPQATAILEKLRTRYEGFASMAADFSLTLEIPDELKEVQEGKLVQKGDKYRLDLETQSIYNDGNALYLYLKNNNEVQINDVPSEEEAAEAGILSPNDILRIYEQGSYVYALTNQYAKGGKLIQEIEFKPLDRESEYSKLRLAVDKKTNNVVSITAFGKDSSRYTLTIKKLMPNAQFEDAYFTFDANKFPGIYVEDLRE
ncbi:MAG: outer membrane lipoprotein carrier protein LolA [Bacteroidota bacterium]